MSRHALALFALPLVAAPLALALAGSGGQELPGPDFPAYVVAEPPTKGLVTLWARDPELQSISFADGLPGNVMEHGQVFNRQIDLDYDNFREGFFSVGIEGGREGVILDLGTQNELEEQYGYEETVGGGQGFASIQVIDGHLSILADYTERTFQPHRSIEELSLEVTGLETYREDRTRIS